MPISHRAAFCKFRCGVAPIRIETGRYENIDVSQRLCNFCNVVEDETHIILDCSANLLRNNLFSKAISVLPSFIGLDSIEKMNFYLPKPVLKSYNIEILSFINNLIYFFFVYPAVVQLLYLNGIVLDL